MQLSKHRGRERVSHSFLHSMSCTIIFFRKIKIGFAVPVNVYINDKDFGQVAASHGLRVIGVPAGKVKVGAYAAMNTPDNHVHELEAGKTYYYMLYLSFGWLLANFKLAWSDEKTFLKSRVSMEQKQYDPNNAAVATTAEAPHGNGPYGTIFLHRQNGFPYYANPVQLEVEEKPLLDHPMLENKQIFELKVSPGTILIRIHHVGMTGKAKDEYDTFPVPIGEGEKKYFSVEFKASSPNPFFMECTEKTITDAHRTPIEFDLRKN